MEDLRENARQFGLELTDDQLEKFDMYMHTLLEWNENYNLTAITKASEIKAKHFLDSLSVVPVLPQDAKRIVDIGAGAGFPGIPVALTRQDLSLTLVDSIGKKVTFLKHAATALGLKNVEVICARAEDLAKEPERRENYDVALARAVAELRVLVEYALPFLKVGGLLIAQKTVSQAEIDAAKPAIAELGARITRVDTVELVGLPPRHLVFVVKTSPTPANFPRRAGQAAKNPL